MKKLITLLLILQFLISSCETPIQKLEGEKKYGRIMFQSAPLEKAIEASKEQNKPIFIDAYTTWCGWCRKLDNTTFQDKEVIELINKNFIPLKIDMEYGQGVFIASDYNIHSYPRMLFLDSTGKVINQIKGYVQAPAFLKLAGFALQKYGK